MSSEPVDAAANNSSPFGDIQRPQRPAALLGRSAALAGLLIAARVVYLRHPVPVHPDETEFMAALGFPTPYPVHPPGYPLWVAMGSLLSLAGLGPYAAYQAWSLAASIAVPVLFYLGLRREPVAHRHTGVARPPQPDECVARPPSAGSHGDERTAWWTALALGVNPLLWFVGVSALNYAAACVLMLVVVGYVRRALEAPIDDVPIDGAQPPSAALLNKCTTTTPRPMTVSQHGALWISSSVLAVGITLRPDLLLLCGPILLFAAWRVWRGRFWMALILPAIGILSVAIVSRWMYPAAPDGGPSPAVAHTWEVLLGTSVFRLGLFDGLLRSVVKLTGFLGWSLALPLGVAVIGAGWNGKGRPATQKNAQSAYARRDDRWFLLLWVGPMTLFLLCVHMSEASHLLLIPAGYAVLAQWLRRRSKPRKAARILAAATAATVLQFMLYPWSADSTGIKRTVDAKIAYVSGAGLRGINRRSEIHQSGDVWPTDAHSTPPARDDPQ